MAASSFEQRLSRTPRTSRSITFPVTVVDGAGAGDAEPWCRRMPLIAQLRARGGPTGWVSADRRGCIGGGQGRRRARRSVGDMAWGAEWEGHGIRRECAGSTTSLYWESPGVPAFPITFRSISRRYLGKPGLERCAGAVAGCWAVAPYGTFLGGSSWSSQSLRSDANGRIGATRLRGVRTGPAFTSMESPLHRPPAFPIRIPRCSCPGGISKRVLTTPNVRL